MGKIDLYQQEHAKLTGIFTGVDTGKAKLVEGLIEDAAFMYAEMSHLREIIKTTGSVQINPMDPTRQKTPEVSKQYLKLLNSYAVVIKTLNGILNKNMNEGEDEFDEWVKQQRNGE
ncbi:hypothetical protein OS242_10545 [Tumebacillus sp. DT12]|uniref:Uncharacterized protein n=1 Tax=Tumebacillus lacus TaxID=2995335 RepID=A0ABT3X1T1_9BACL|nr:hypothetical protein [Tumebacillus lacus]MCX7570401.1 hypothetical protein [Tumebacillus lacus]